MEVESTETTEQGSVEETKESTQSEETSEAPVTSQADMLRASLQGANVVDKAESEDPDSQEEKEKGETPSEKPKPKAEKEVPAVSPELQKFFVDKGLDPDKLDPMKIAEMARNSEALMNKKINEAKLKEAKVKDKQLDKDAESVVSSEKETTETDVPLSPRKQLDKTIQDQFELILSVTGTKNEAELLEKFPDAHGRFSAMVNAAKSDILDKELDWRESQKGEKESKAEADTRIREEYEGVKQMSQDNIDKAKKNYPEIAADMKNSGLMDMLDELANITKVPVQYFTANDKFFSTFAKMAKAMVEIDKLPERDKKTKQEVEKEIAETKKAETVAAGEGLPNDHKAGVQQEFKQSFHKQHESASATT